jgi:prolyl-tRNA synthetase
MRLSQLFTKTTKTVPAEETALNARLLIQAGYVYKVMSGVYAYTTLGLMVIENIKRVIREEMNAISGQEVLLSNLQPREPWEITTRWDDKIVDIWFKTKLKDGAEVGLAWSHEEPVIEMMKQYVQSYKDLPVSIYQFQNKLRNELRAKSGLMRGREFIMKDMYSMSVDAAQHDKYYNSAIEAYNKVFERLGIGQDTFMTFASGGAFTKFSHEFQTTCETGEDTIYLHREKNIAINEEVMEDKTLAELGIKREELEQVKSSEVGNIFNFGTDKSKQMDFSFTDETGKRQFVHLGSYGIGVTRLVGVIAEKLSDAKGLVWPEAVAPAKVYIVQIGSDAEVVKQAEQLYDDLTAAGVSVLYDERDARPGEKFADADLLGIPHRVVISDKTLSSGTYEWKKRTAEAAEQVSRQKLMKTLGINN